MYRKWHIAPLYRGQWALMNAKELLPHGTPGTIGAEGPISIARASAVPVQPGGDRGGAQRCSKCRLQRHSACA